MKNISIIVIILCFQLLRSEVALDQAGELYISPNFSINSFQSYDNDVLDAYDYSPSFGLDIEYTNKSPWRIVGKFNYYLVPDWFPMEISLGVKKMNNIKAIKSLQYYWSVNLDYKALRYTGSNDKWGYNYISGARPASLSYYHELNKGDWISAIGIDLNYGLNYLFNDKYYIDFQIGYKLYSFCLKEGFKFIELGYLIDLVDYTDVTYLKTLEGNDDFINPDGFFLKFGLGVNLWQK